MPAFYGPNPYQGLKPFETEVADLFFGRERQISALLERFRSSRFLAVVGVSGSGKSSLVRAGLIPSLNSGFLFEAGNEWRWLAMRPGSNPYAALADALAELYRKSGQDASTRFLQSVLKGSSQGLVECARGLLDCKQRENLLVVVDQFEEIFPISIEDSSQLREQRASFTRALMEAARQSEVNVYVLLTMRSDFIGRCQEIEGLPEAMNDSQFLVPRMTREELQLAITAPARISKAEIQPALLQTLLNEVHTEQDQLPLLQHVLYRTWRNWQTLSPEPGAQLSVDAYQTVGEYRESGELRASIESQGNELVFGVPDRANGLGPRQKAIASRVFQAITYQPKDAEAIRRPLPLERVTRVCRRAGTISLLDIKEEEVEEVIELFRAEGVHFLRPYPTEEQHLAADSRIDLSHESLMRKWGWLADSIKHEARARDSLIALALAGQHYWDKPRTGSLWRDAELKAADKLLSSHGWNKDWAKLYVNETEYNSAERFLRRSKLRRALVRSVATAASFIAVVLALSAFEYQIRVRDEKATLNQKLLDDDQKLLYDERKTSAEQADRLANETRLLRLADEARKTAVAAQAEAERQRNIAKEQAALAEGDSVLANHAREETDAALRRAQIATKSAQDAQQELITKNDQLRAQYFEATARAAEAMDATDPDPARQLIELYKAVTDLSDEEHYVLRSSLTALDSFAKSSLAQQRWLLPQPVLQVNLSSRQAAVLLPGRVDHFELGQALTAKHENASLLNEGYSKFALSASGELFAGGGVKGALRINDLSSTRTSGNLRINNFPITALAFDSSGSNLLIGTSTGTTAERSVEDLFNRKGQDTKLAFERFFLGFRLVLALIFHRAGDNYPIRNLVEHDGWLATLDDGGNLRFAPRGHDDWLVTLDADGDLSLAPRGHAVVETDSIAWNILAAGPGKGEFTVGTGPGKGESRVDCTGPHPTKANCLVMVKVVDSKLIDRPFPSPGWPVLSPISEAITSLSWNEAGTRVAVGQQNGRILIFNPSGELLIDLDTIAGPIQALSWSGTRLISGSAGGEVKVWDLELDAPFTRLLAASASLQKTTNDDRIATNSGNAATLAELLKLWDERIKKIVTSPQAVPEADNLR